LKLLRRDTLTKEIIERDGLVKKWKVYWKKFKRIYLTKHLNTGMKVSLKSIRLMRSKKFWKPKEDFFSAHWDGTAETEEAN
jgi:prolyl-tRNA synthetase